MRIWRDPESGITAGPAEGAAGQRFMNSFMEIVVKQRQARRELELRLYSLGIKGVFLWDGWFRPSPNGETAVLTVFGSPNYREGDSVAIFKCAGSYRHEVHIYTVVRHVGNLFDFMSRSREYELRRGWVL
jgi:hypothetical protein